MKFIEALKHINHGCKMRAVSWDNKNASIYFRDNEDHNNIDRVVYLTLEDVNDEWEHFEKPEPQPKIKIKARNISFYTARHFHDTGFKIAREDWSNDLFIKDGVMYDGDSVFIARHGSMFDFEDIESDDWVAYE